MHIVKDQTQYFRIYYLQRSHYLCHRWQTQGLRAKSGPPPCFIWPAPCFFYPVAVPSSRLTVRDSYMYTALKLHSALWKQLWGWCGLGENEFDTPDLCICIFLMAFLIQPKALSYRQSYFRWLWSLIIVMYLLCLAHP